MVFVVTAVVGLLFGAGDQYLGSLRPMVLLGPWTVAVSQMSSLWLLLPFVAGCTQERTRRAALVGLTASASALLGYFAMTVSPIEGVPAQRIPTAAVALLASNLTWIVGGLVTGPLFGLLGQRCRIRRSWAGAAGVTGLLLFEPVVRHLSGRIVGPSWVWTVEATVGVVLVATLLVLAALRRSPIQPG
jgi:Family of unknown function (DUF6518)